MDDMILAAFVGLVMIVSFLLGKYHERCEWNELIENDALPKPNKNWRYDD